MLFSFCVNCMNRLEDLQKTLPYNLSRLWPDEEIVILDYNCRQGTREWVMRSFPAELANHRIRLFSERTAPRFFMAGAKNVSHLLASGSVLVNLDADNRLDTKYLEDLRGAPWPGGLSILYASNGNGGWKGRTAIDAQTFRRMGGYDEMLNWGYGYEEIDLLRRIKAMRTYQHMGVHVDESSVIVTPDTVKAWGQAEPGITIQQSNRHHMKLSYENVKTGRLIANFHRTWGMAEVIDHNGHKTLVGHRS